MGKLQYFAASLAAGALVLLGACAKTPVTQAKSVTQVQKPAVVTPLNAPVTGAAFTSVNETADGSGHCKNGNPNNNCNIYDGKQYVWLNGGPVAADVGDGTYFFAVVAPSGQGGNDNPNDGTPMNLSDVAPTSNTGAGDAYTNRTFTISNGAISYGGSHDFDSNKIRLMPYDDTPNPGGVYILAICSLADGYPVNPSDCKYDAFKVQKDGVISSASSLTITKDAEGSYDNTYTWTITKDVDKTTVKQVGGNATFNYTVTVTHDAGTTSNFRVDGTITVFNPNVDGSSNAYPVDITNVTDALSDSTNCTVTGGGAQTLTNVETSFAYSCSLSGLPQGQLDNTATVTWPEQFLDDGSLLAAGSADFTFTDIGFVAKLIDESVTVTDSYAGTLGSVTVGDANPTSFTYARTIAVPQYDCQSYDNTATFTTNDTGATGSASQTVSVCGPEKTGALTIGFWQNKNGQSIITAQAKTGVCPSGTWLRQYAPYQDLSASATCAQVATYVYNVIKAADASGAAMNAMLKAQMLATGLDVYFSDPALGGNKINAPTPVGGVMIDLTLIYKKVAGLYENVSSAFGGATSLSVSQMLSYAASQSNIGGSVWYGQVKATQELAKDAFDAINNQWAFAP